MHWMQEATLSVTTLRATTATTAFRYGIFTSLALRDFTAQLLKIATPAPMNTPALLPPVCAVARGDMRKNDFICVQPHPKHRFSAQQKQRKSMFITGQGERASGRSVAEPRKTRQKRTESHRKRTKFTRKRTVFHHKRTVFGGNGQGFTKHPQTPPRGQDPMIFGLAVFFARPPRRSVRYYRGDRVLRLWHHTPTARPHNWGRYFFSHEAY